VKADVDPRVRSERPVVAPGLACTADQAGVDSALDGRAVEDDV
jgi:hypothetical protein